MLLKTAKGVLKNEWPRDSLPMRHHWDHSLCKIKRITMTQSGFWVFLRELHPGGAVIGQGRKQRTGRSGKLLVHQQICCARFQPSYSSYLLPLLHLLLLLQLLTPSVGPNTESAFSWGFSLRVETWKDGLWGREGARGQVRSWRWGGKAFLRFY